MISQTKRFIVAGFFVLIAVAAYATGRGTAAPPAAPQPAAQPAAQEPAPAAQAEPKPAAEPAKPQAPFDSAQKQPEADRKSAGCITCHSYDKEQEPYSMHPFGPANIGCADCHGGNFEVTRPEGTNKGDDAFDDAKDRAHVQPKYPEIWKRDGKRHGANPVRLTAQMNRESPEYIQFVNPGDLRVADRTCGVSGCHEKEVANVDTSMMKHGALLWEAALYNNGGFLYKNARFGESYTKEGQPERLYPVNPISDDEAWDKMILKGMVPYLDPLPRWNIAQPGNVLRVFEHGEDRLSLRGFGTGNRTDPVFLGLQKTRLLDPTLNFLGTNDQPGDFRSSGCTACHTPYANDRDTLHDAIVPRSNLRTSLANNGKSRTTDPMIDLDAEGHPLRHILTNNIPSSSCMVCHMHPGTNMVTTYYGMIWWDNETDGDQMYAADIKDPSPEKMQRIGNRNPEESALRGKWGEREFLDDVGKPGGEINKNLKVTQFGDFHGHGWIYRAVFKSDRRGNYLDHKGNVVPNVNAELMQQGIYLEKDPTTGMPMYKDGVPVHQKDIHIEMGMQCVDCHFSQDGHGNGNLYGEVRAAIEIDCIDCHGTNSEYATLKTSGPAAPEGKVRGNDLSKMKTKFLVGDREREVTILQKLTRDVEVGKPIPRTAAIAKVPYKKGDVIQASYTDPEKVWRVKQTKDTVVKSATRPEDYNELSSYAKTIQADNKTWGDPNAADEKLAHGEQRMTCFACHTSWTTSCFGCHLPMRANKRQPQLHNGGEDSRNWTNYNFQTLRDDIYMLGRDGTVMGSRIAPVRSSCAVLVGSQSINREWFYSQQQTISTEGYSGQAFSTYMPHTVRGKGETKQCEDCHVNQANNNNAVMAHVTVQGTNAANFIGRIAYVAAGDDGIDAVTVTERREPQAVFGSTLHSLAFPREYKKFVDGGRKLTESYGHSAIGREALSIHARGEYLYVANGRGGLQVYDTSRVDDKLFAQRITTSIVSPIGQRLYLDTEYATAVASPTTLGVDPTASVFHLTKVPLSHHYRMHHEENQEGPYRVNWKWANNWRYKGNAGGEQMYDPQLIAPLYAFLYVTDREEGLIMTLAATLLDGDPENNFLKRQEFGDGKDAWNPDGVLDGAVNIEVAGNYAYICADRGVVIVDITKLDEHLRPVPRVVKIIPANKPTSVQVQFRYAFFTDADGLKVVDLTNPEDPQLVEAATLRITEAKNVYISRTYAFVAAGSNGLAIVDVETPTQPKAFPWLPGLFFNANGEMDDTHDVTIGWTNNSMFAYVADGDNGLRILQLLNYQDGPGIYGFSPQLSPKLIATRKLGGDALAVAEGIERDRAVDESGNQLAVFGRRGARPFNFQEMRKLYISSVTGQPYTVTNAPPGPPVAVTPKPEDRADADAAEGGSAPRGFAASPLGTWDLVPLLLPMGLLLLRPRSRPRAGRRK